MVNLATVPDRELMKVGNYDLSTGPFEITRERIQDTIKAHEAGVLRKPVVRLGHNDSRFSGDPAVGWVENVRASEDGNTLYGDLVGVPQWLADIMPSAYPSLSVEGMYDYTAPDGSEHPFILTGLALLGSTPPGIGSLQSMQDVAKLYEIDEIAAAVGQIGGTPIKFNMEMPVSNETSVIQIEAAEASDQKGAVVALPEKLAEALGIDASADEDTINAAWDTYIATAETSRAELVAASAAPPGVVQLAGDQYDQLVAAAEAGQRAEARQIAGDREAIVMAAIKDGRISPAGKADWIKALETDPGDHNKTALASLRPGLIPVTEAGHSLASEGEPADQGLENVHDRVMASLGLSTKKGIN